LTTSSSIAVASIGRYLLKEKLPRGEFGISYRAWDSVLKRYVMMKLMPSPLGVSENEWKELKWRFLQEARAAGRLRHPGIISVYEAGEYENFVFSVIEYRQEATLADHTEPGNLLPVDKTLSIGERIAKSLDYAHRHLVVHRDVRPANINFEPATGVVTLGNFGLARLLDSTRTRTGAVLGTPSGYMSPEQISGKKVDHRTDLYSLGVMLFQLLTGTLPFEGRTYSELMGHIVFDPAPGVRQRRAELAPAVEDLLAIALDKRADKRFQTGSTMARAIKACAKQN
jgi:serine/threonine-protein kinase